MSLSREPTIDATYGLCSRLRPLKTVMIYTELNTI